MTDAFRSILRRETRNPPECCAAGGHVGDLADFDHYLEINDIPHDRAGEAFADYLTLQYGWDGQVQRVDLHIEE